MEGTKANLGLVVAVLTLFAGCLAIPGVVEWMFGSRPKPPTVQPPVPPKATTPTVVEPKEPYQNKTPPKSANGYGSVVIQPSKETSHPDSPAPSKETLHPDSPAPLRPFPATFAFLIGEWECLTPGNHYRMRVDWDGASRQFRGYLTKQGQASENMGFRLAELVWIAEPNTEHLFIERQEWRRGANGIPSDYEWRNGNFDIERSSPDHLIVSQEFMRVR